MDDQVLFWNLITGYIGFLASLNFVDIDLEYPIGYNHDLRWPVTRISDIVDDFFVPIPVEPSFVEDENNAVLSEMNVEKARFHTLQLNWYGKNGLHAVHRARIGLTYNKREILYQRLHVWQTCSNCDGIGANWRYDSVGNMTYVTCSVCLGTGGSWKKKS